jgi:hypothetical protein
MTDGMRSHISGSCAPHYFGVINKMQEIVIGMANVEAGHKRVSLSTGRFPVCKPLIGTKGVFVCERCDGDGKQEGACPGVHPKYRWNAINY